MTIGITQRVELCKDYHEIRDCLDQEWTNLLCKANIDFILVPNSLDDIDSWLEKKNLEGFILTGGNDLSHLPDAKNPAPNRDETEKKILKWSVKNKTKVLCLDGDGSALMHLGAMANSAKIKNLIHIVFNNLAHDSVGGQIPPSENINFFSVAQKMGYHFSYKANNAKQIEEKVKVAFKNKKNDRARNHNSIK